MDLSKVEKGNTKILKNELTICFFYVSGFKA